MYKTMLFVFLSGILFLSGCGIVCSSGKKLLLEASQENGNVYIEGEDCIFGFMTSAQMISYKLYINKDGRRTVLDKVVAAADRFLHRMNYNFESKGLQRHFEHIDYDDIFDLMAAKFGYDLMQTSQAKHIVCIDPLIVIVEPASVYKINDPVILHPDYNTHKPTANIRQNGDWYGLTPYEYKFVKEYWVFIELNGWNDASVVYNGYIIGGTIAGGTGNLLWFSPDMKIAPQSVDIDADGVGHIPVPWGELVLTKENDDWVVTAKGN